MTEMSARALAIYQRTYSRQQPGGSYETFPETVDRVVQHQAWLWARALGLELSQAFDYYDRVSDVLPDAAQAELAALKELMLARRVLPSGRTMWLGGTEVARTRECSQFACASLAVRTVYDVVDLTWLLLNGCGIGAKPRTGVLNGFATPIDDVRVVRSKRTAPGGRETNLETWEPATATWTISVGDSGEAWARAVGKLVAGKHRARTLVLDFSQIRPEGSLLSRYGWRSAGDTVISAELVKIARLLSRRAGQLLSKLDVCDLVNHLGVIQTGRRGAEILVVDEGDPEVEAFMRFKDGCYADPERTQRQQSNNSIMFYERPSRARLVEIFDTIVATGGNEPGFINAAAARLRAPWFTAPNPCVEVLNGDKGFCNLFETDVAKFSHLGPLCEALRLVARANYRQTLVNLDDGVLQRSWHELNEFLRLCGVSLTGLARRPDLTAHDLKTMRSAAVSGAWAMADELGQPRPKNVTCVKPSGTLGKVMDTTEGNHKPLGRYVFNSVVYQRVDPLVAALRDAGYEVRPHPTAETQVLVKFPVESQGVDYGGGDLNLEPAVDQLNRYQLLMDWWCDQNVSQTIYYDPDEVPAIIDWLLAHWDSYVGVSWGFRTDPTKTAADFGAAYLPQAVVTREEFEEYVSNLRSLETGEGLGGALLLNDLDTADCEAGVCPVR
jgi:adenosylcobalamin-dependent ribonucleoside-triphosphate reductase